MEDTGEMSTDINELNNHAIQAHFEGGVRNSLSERKIPFDHKIKERERTTIITALELLPTEVTNHLMRVNLLPRGHASFARFEELRGFGKGILEVNRELFSIRERDVQLTILHEVGGHGILDGLHSLDQDLFGQIEDNWLQIFEQYPELLSKDRNSGHELSCKDTGIGKLALNQEEFIADRMAEYFAVKSGKFGEHQVHFLRKKDNPFTEEEETAVQSACELTYAQFMTATQLTPAA
ncbi:MAG: hypothetical protein KatS3mg087_0383 [Patescibacteria group bacterium]|nr:MAG: hypothetical protein KatS3mg087_0383 [Patescibacteria group bacterium]